MKYAYDTKTIYDIELNCGFYSSLIARAGYELFLSINKIISNELNIRHTLKICIVIGYGNNGIDGAEVAIYLSRYHYVTVLILNNNFNIEYIKKFEKLFIDIQYGYVFNFESFAIIIDGIFGIGLNRDIDNKHVELIQNINNIKAIIIAIDIPSGIFTDTGECCKEVIRANYTIVLGIYKPGLFILPAADYVGIIKFVDLGYKNISKKNPSMLIYDITDKVPMINNNATKYTRGVAGIITGSLKYPGAALMSIGASLYTASGAIKYFDMHNLRDVIISQYPELLISNQFSTRINSLLVGCGISNNAQAVESVNYAINSKVLTIFDADALNIIASVDYIDKRKYYINKISSMLYKPILTPNITEASRLLNCDIQYIQSHYLEAAKSISKIYNVVVILKSHNSIVVNNNMIFSLEKYTSYLSKAGSGDMLAGLLVGFLSTVNGDMIDRILFAMYLHNRSAELCNQPFIKINDAINNLKYVLRSIYSR